MKVLNITYEFLFQKKEEGLAYVLRIDKRNTVNLLYEKEVYIPPIEGSRDILFQCLGNIGCYANNHFDSTIDYIFLTDKCIDNLTFGIKDDLIKWIEYTCAEQKLKCGNPDRWRFNMSFILEHEVVNFIRKKAQRDQDDYTLNMINRY